MVLALRMGRTVPELLAATSGADLTEWAGFNNILPLADWNAILGAPAPAERDVGTQVRAALLGAAGPFLKGGKPKRRR